MNVMRSGSTVLDSHDSSQFDQVLKRRKTFRARFPEEPLVNNYTSTVFAHHDSISLTDFDLALKASQ